MIPNNNLSVLPWYDNIEEQNARKWWAYNRIYPLFTPAKYLLPFQIQIPITEDMQLIEATLYDAKGNAVTNLRYPLLNSGIAQKKFADFSVIIYPGTLPVLQSLADGQYYIHLTIDTDTQGEYEYWSEVFTVVNDTSSYLKIVWWNTDDFIMDAGTIVYKYANGTQFRNELYLCADIGKPEYIFEEEGETRDGYFFPIKQISEKRYKFSFLASEYLLDVMRFIRMADFAKITYQERQYNLDTFLITPDWEDNGDVASVQAEFDTATVAKKIGFAYTNA